MSSGYIPITYLCISCRNETNDDILITENRKNEKLASWVIFYI